MGEKISLQTAVDVSVTTTTPGRFGSTRLYANTEAQSYIYYQIPVLPAGSVIASAKLNIYAGGALAAKTSGFPTAKIHRLTQAFDANNISWATRPSQDAAAAATQSAPVGPGFWSFDITALVQNVVNGQAWYGMTLVSNSTEFEYWLGSQANTPMYLEIEWSAAPRVPTELKPSGNSIVNQTKPVLSWNVSGSSAGERPYGFQVEVSAASNMSSPWSSGTIISPSSLLDLSTTGFTALTNGQTRYWRVKVRNEAGIWSDWSTVAQFQYVTPGVVTITTASPTNDPTPQITWTVTGVTQQAYQIKIAVNGNINDPRGLVYDSGVVAGTTNSVEAPQGLWKYNGDIYQVEIRVWDDFARAATSGVTTYVKDVKAITYTPTGIAPAVQLDVTKAGAWPFAFVKWQYTAASPDFFYLYHKRAEETEWRLFAAVTPAQTAIPGQPTWFNYTDYYVPGRCTMQWMVIAVKNTVGSSWPNIVDELKIKNSTPWLFSNYYGPTYGFPLVNANIDTSLSEIADIVTPISGAPFLVSQGFKGIQGSVTGELVKELADGMTTQDMRQDFLFMRKNPRCVFVYADEAVDCYIYNCNITPNPRADGDTDYVVSFEFIQVGGEYI